MFRFKKCRATEILKCKRSLALPMIRRIAKERHVPERLLVRGYAVGWGRAHLVQNLVWTYFRKR
jgi:hypothetical protein